MINPLKNNLYVAFVACCCVLLAATSCSKQDALADLEKVEMADMRMVEAMEMQQRGEVQAAQKIYRDVVVMHPTNALAHLQLGIVLQDSQRAPEEAIYHFETYLHLRPEAEKVKMVNDRIRQAKDEMGRRFGHTSAAVDVVALEAGFQDQIKALKAEIADGAEQLQRAKSHIESSQKEADRLSKEVARLQKLLDTMLEKGDTVTPTPHYLGDLNINSSVQSTTTSPASSMGTYAVKRGDTLWTIAQRVYGDASRNVDIREANKAKLGASDALKEGMILVIP